MKMIDKYKAKGNLTFFVESTKKGYSFGYTTKTIDNIVNEYTKINNEPEFHKLVEDSITGDYTFEIYTLMSGKDFLEAVLDGCIIDYDGSIANIFVDGFKSNLGLRTNNLTSGKFLVDEQTFRDICNTHTVEVNWANK